MSYPTDLPPQEPQDFRWLVDNFAMSTPGVTHALIVSSDGLPLIAWAGYDHLQLAKAIAAHYVRKHQQKVMRQATKDTTSVAP